jgi:hypothetical protein
VNWHPGQEEEGNLYRRPGVGMNLDVMVNAHG